MIQNQLLAQLLTQGKYDTKVFPHIIYAGCALAVYSFAVLPVSEPLGITIPEFPLEQSPLFWSFWSAVVLTGTLKRSAVKSHILHKLIKS